jgi:hypothetical protein
MPNSLLFLEKDHEAKESRGMLVYYFKCEINSFLIYSLLPQYSAGFSFSKVLLDFCMIPSTEDKSCQDYHVSLF